MRRQPLGALFAVSVALLSWGACESELEPPVEADAAGLPATHGEPAESARPNDRSRPQPGAYSGETIPGGENIAQCCQIGNRVWLSVDGAFLVRRTYGTPCREEDGEGTNCGMGTGVQCAYGPCGVRNDWRLDGEDVIIFEPESDPASCGWSIHEVTRCTDALHPTPGLTLYDDEMCDDDLWQEKGYKPEQYVDQPVYGGVTGTCSYNRCVDGEPH